MAGRPPIYTDDILVRIDAKGVNKLQHNSARRAVINHLVEHRGKLSIGQINEHFGFDMTPTILDLVKVGWCEVEV